jgi:branched-chain amino acid transport system permease protein
VISLVFPIAVTQLIYSGGAWTGSSSGLVGYDSLPLDLTGFFRLNGFFLVAVVAAAWIFVRSDARKRLIALRDNETRCDYLGLNPKRMQIILTTIMAEIAGAAGFLFA